MKNNKNKRIKIIILTIMLISIIILTISIVNLIRWNKDNKKIQNIINDVEDIVNVEDNDIENDNIEVIEQEEDIPKENPYWDYIKMSLINVDFTELKEKYPNVVGWLQVNGTNINYPFVQTSNNDYYLTHDLGNNRNSAGWIFADYRNNLKNDDKNTIIYAHARLDKTMFGTLGNVLKSNWLNDPNNYIIKLSTEYENTLWQVFSVYYISSTNDYLYTGFATSDDFMKFIDRIKRRSAYNFNTNVSKDDRILTLTTCHGKTEKTVLHAKLIKKEVR